MQTVILTDEADFAAMKQAADAAATPDATGSGRCGVRERKQLRPANKDRKTAPSMALKKTCRERRVCALVVWERRPQRAPSVVPWIDASTVRAEHVVTGEGRGGGVEGGGEGEGEGGGEDEDETI